MDSLRIFAALILAVSSFLLVEAWFEEDSIVSQTQEADEPYESNQPKNGNENEVPEVSVSLDRERESRSAKITGAERIALDEQIGNKVKVKTDLFEITYNSIGPEIEKVELLKHPSKENSDENFVILNKTFGHNYTGQIGLIGDGLANHKDEFFIPEGQYELAVDSDVLEVPFSIVKDNVTVIHTFTFTRGSYAIKINTMVKNGRQEDLDVHAYYQLVRDDSNPSGSSMMMPTYTGVALYTEDSKYKKIDFSDIKKGQKKYPNSADNGWIAIIQHYFLGAWLPEDGKPREYFTRLLKNNLYGVGVILPIGNIPSQSSGGVQNRLYVGPQDQDNLSELSSGLNLTVDYGWLTIIASPLFRVLKWINEYVSNWGWSIVVLTILIKLIFYPLSAASYKSMAKMRVVAPKLQKLKELYGSDKQRMQQEMMSLYKKEQINPLGGCLPILVQIPVFIALYWVLLASVELRYAPFILWIDDLSAKDPFYVLPILMGLSMIIQTRLNPTPPDPVQAKIMKIMPIVFSVFFFFFPAGLVLYWLANNILSIAQQWRITRVIEGKTRANVPK